MAEHIMNLKIDSASFKKLIVPAYKACMVDKFVYNHMLIVKHGNDIISYGVDFFSCYRVNLDIKKSNIEVSKGFRVCLFASDLLEKVSKILNKDSTVFIIYKLGHKSASIIVENTKNDNIGFEVPVLIEARGERFPDELVATLFTDALEDSAVSEKVFNFVFFDRMIKHIKTAVTSPIERKSLAILCTRSGASHADIFAYKDWFAAIIMPIRR